MMLGGGLGGPGGLELRDTLPDDGPPDEPLLRLRLERALDRLPHGMRRVLVLHDVEGLEHREVAEALGIAEGTSKS